MWWDEAGPNGYARGYDIKGAVADSVSVRQHWTTRAGAPAFLVDHDAPRISIQNDGQLTLYDPHVLFTEFLQC